MSSPSIPLPLQAHRDNGTRVQSPSLFKLNIFDIGEARQLKQSWRDLCANAVEPNVFYGPDFLLPAAETFGGNDLKLLTLRTDDRFAFLLPFRLKGLAPFQVAEAFIHPYATTAVPLVHTELASSAVAGWLDAGRQAVSAAAWRLPALPANGQLHSLIHHEITRRGASSAIIAHRARALLKPQQPDRTYLHDVLSHKALKQLRRQARRLGDLGALEYRVLTDAAAGPGFDEFLRLEAAGWKGRAKTAMMLDDSIARFSRRAMQDLARHGHMRIDQLVLDDSVIAATVTLTQASSFWLWKIAYDEGFAKYSPAVQLVAAMTADLAASWPSIRIDSCAIPDHSMINRLWRERLPLEDLMIAKAGSFAFSGAVTLAKSHYRARDLARKVMRR